MKNRWLDRDMLLGPYLTLCTTEQQFTREMTRLKVPRPPLFVSRGANATTHFLVSPQNKRTTVVCMPADPERTGVEIAGLLVHEAVHVWQEYCDSIGEDAPSAEFEAYSVQTISQRLMWEYERQVLKPRKLTKVKRRKS